MSLVDPGYVVTGALAIVGWELGGWAWTKVRPFLVHWPMSNFIQIDFWLVKPGDGKRTTTSLSANGKLNELLPSLERSLQAMMSEGWCPTTRGLRRLEVLRERHKKNVNL